MKETDIARPIVDQLKADHEVYQEVRTSFGVVDIVAVVGSIRWAIEAKTSLNLVVLDQALGNTRLFHYSSVAVPHARRDRSLRAATRFLTANGIGLIYVGKHGSITTAIEPRFHRRVLSVTLHDQQKYYAQAGTAGGGHFTDFKSTRDRLIEYVTKYPGCTIKEAIEQVGHHYRSTATAVQCVRKYVKTSVIPELRNDRGRLYPADCQPDNRRPAAGESMESAVTQQKINYEG